LFRHSNPIVILRHDGISPTSSSSSRCFNLCNDAHSTKCGTPYSVVKEWLIIIDSVLTDLSASGRRGRAALLSGTESVWGGHRSAATPTPLRPPPSPGAAIHGSRSELLARPPGRARVSMRTNNQCEDTLIRDREVACDRVDAVQLERTTVAYFPEIHERGFVEMGSH
jgi:hypothetical protein